MENSNGIKELDVVELKKWRDEGKDFELIDVREPNEYDLTHIGGKLIPLGQVGERASEISKEKTVVVMCRSGKRSSTAILELQEKFGYSNLWNLKGGILAWASEIDPSIPRY